ncbi:MAG: glycosyltransferase [Nitrososphaerota archaeon]|jgi:glycosyltransferase involved in cell wall biosynthesis|uniref:glycosyltransferase family 2 protein n=1 Tax=Candidatus Bathycorpusculum sp. TaxID=2994959 RepID=UPI00282535A8|nr:glycosyltransferase [Candidatus Termitimicrobium sp.]MCL2431307.1 glycosyltransferase [Candidatus Termitimicrobium sp.]MDR0493826.1 glycosyltransferase [Nitrososphaerota archaeon]
MSRKVNNRQNFWVTVVIPTHKRANVLPYLLAALNRQTYKNFDVIFVVKPSGDDTNTILKEATGTLKLKVVIQTEGYIVDAYFLGVKHSTGDIVAFLDDDALPADNWLQETVKIFRTGKVDGITGDSFPVLLKNDKIEIIEESEVPVVFSHFEFALFGCPIKGLEKYKNAIANSGLVYERGNNPYWRKHGATKALLRGPSMAVWGDVLREINLPGEWFLGCAWEMVLGWQLWRKGFRLIYSPKVKVYHIVHGRTSSRDFLNPRADLLWAVEAELLFYRLYGAEPQLSMMSKIGSDIFRVAHSLKHIRSNQLYQLRKIEGIVIGNIIGIKWLLYKSLGASYSPLSDLVKLKKTQT